jgi:hypothetical protein
MKREVHVRFPVALIDIAATFHGEQFLLDHLAIVKNASHY